VCVFVCVCRTAVKGFVGLREEGGGTEKKKKRKKQENKKKEKKKWVPYCRRGTLRWSGVYSEGPKEGGTLASNVDSSKVTLDPSTNCGAGLGVFAFSLLSATDQNPIGKYYGEFLLGDLTGVKEDHINYTSGPFKHQAVFASSDCLMACVNDYRDIAPAPNAEFQYTFSGAIEVRAIKEIQPGTVT
jgi:hypothetical protein